MELKEQFEYVPFLDVNAAQVGIGKWNWISSDGEDKEKAIRVMQENKFDVLPVINKDGKITSYYSTRLWNDYSCIKRYEISQADTIYYKTSIKNVIEKFKKEGNHYYFLTDYNQILGLISFANLNTKVIYNYLYQIIADLERLVSNFIKGHVTQEEILEDYKNSSSSVYRKFADEFENKKHDSGDQNNDDNDIFQEMYLSHLGFILKKVKNKLPPEKMKILDYRLKFEGNEGVYCQIRNKVMHPVKHILSDEKAISQIDEVLNDYIKIKEILCSKHY